MKRIALWGVSLLILAGLSACKSLKDEPTADFSTLNEGCHVPCDITFTNESEDAWVFEWDFGDGSEVSTDHDVVHSFTSSPSGEGYNVSLTATGRDGTVTTSRLVRVNPAFNRFIIDRVDLTDLHQKTALFELFDPNSVNPADIPPDVFFTIRDDDSNLYCTSETAENVGEDALPQRYNPTECTVDGLLNDTYTFDFYDEDGSVADSISSLEFNPFDYKTEFADETVIFRLGRGSIVRVEVTGHFE